MDIIQRIESLREQHKLSVNNLAMEAGLTQSTLNSMLKRNTPPKIETLQCICKAFKITLSQFFLEDEQSELVTENEKELLALYRRLPTEKQLALLDFMKKQ